MSFDHLVEIGVAIGVLIVAIVMFVFSVLSEAGFRRARKHDRQEEEGR